MKMTIHATITLYKSEIIYDVQNKSHLTARSRSGELGPEQVSHLQVNDSEPDMNQILRSIGNAFDKLKPKLSPYIRETPGEHEARYKACNCIPKMRTAVADNALTDLGENRMQIALEMPQNFDTVFLPATTTALHGYIVNTALAEWATYVNPEAAALHYELAEKELQEAKNYLNARTARVRRRQSVF